MATERDFVRTIEAAYVVDRTASEWLTGILESSRPWFYEGAGVFGCEWEIVDDGSVAFTEFASLGNPGVDFAGFMAHAPKEIGRMGAEVLRSNRSGLSSRVLQRPELSEFFFAPLRAMGIVDTLGINGLATPRSGVWVGASLTRSRALARGEERLLARLARHLAAGSRLRKRLSGRTPSDADAAAVLSPVGRVEHASPLATAASVRAALREAVVAMDRARGAERRTNPSGAVRRWRVLADARFTLMDRFESDGRRYVVACENEPAKSAAPRLTARERQVVALYRLGTDPKLIAYELGIAHATVRVLLSRAARRAGAATPRTLRALKWD